MKAPLGITLMSAIALASVTPGVALAQEHDTRWEGERDSNWDPARHYEDESNRGDERVMTENDRVYRGSDGRYYCKRNDGSTGLVIGGLAGGVLGNIIGGGLLGTLLGAGGGALLGKKIDKDREEVKCK